MGLKSYEQKLSFEILRASSLEDTDDVAQSPLFRSSSDPSQILGNGNLSPHHHNSRRKKKHRKKKEKEKAIPEDPPMENGEVLCEDRMSYCAESLISVVMEDSISQSSMLGFGELRQRNVTWGGAEEPAAAAEEAVEEVGTIEQQSVASGSVGTKLETAESLDWKKLMAEDPNYLFTGEKSPLQYFMEEMSYGNSLRNTTTLGSEKEREKVYDTIFRLPWRCEVLMDVGFFVCLDSFLSLLTIMPTRIVLMLWRFLATRQFKRPSAEELCDFGCFVVLACGVILLERTDISLIYHMIRGQGTIKLYVVYNVLEIFDKLCQNFGGDVLEALFNSAEGLANCSEENLTFWIRRFVSDQALATAFSILHSFILLAQAITLSTCIVAHNNALFALLVSNNFAEIKGNVFKRFSKDNIHSLVYNDSVERFHISAFLLFVLAQNILEGEGHWLQSFVYNASVVFLCEMLIDIIKHSFLAKFNGIKPIAYSEFLEALCKQVVPFPQTLDVQREDGKKILTFVPVAPACVVIRVLTPVYAAYLTPSPLPLRLLSIFFMIAMTYIMLTTMKVMIGMGLQKHATWYVDRCRRRKKLHHD